MRILLVLFGLITWALAACPASSRAQDGVDVSQLPMYGGMDRNADPQMKAKDELFIRQMTTAAGSREVASMMSMGLGAQSFVRGDLTTAMRRVNQAWLLNPDNPYIYQMFASVLLQRNQSCEGLKMVDLAMSKGPMPPSFLPDAALLYAECGSKNTAPSGELRRGYFAKSDELFAKALVNPAAEKEMTLANWARAMNARGDYAGAWQKVAEYRGVAGKDVDERFLSELRARMPEPKSISTVAVSAVNAALNEGKAAYSRGDYASAISRFRALAEQGNVDAQNRLGFMYENGQGVARDDAEAVKWYRKAADQGYAYGQYNLGQQHERGEGTAEDKAQAAKWYRKAADQGLDVAQNALAVMYLEGKGVAQDNTLALQWVRKAADQGLPSAQYNLGRTYELGRGTLKDKAEAVKWYRIAANQGHVPALDALRRLGQR